MGHFVAADASFLSCAMKLNESNIVIPKKN